jgi:septal ring factor EnvC (AmiA/AmiB activator)
MDNSMRILSRYALIVPIVFLVFSSPSISGIDEVIKKKKEELARLRKEIESYEKQIRESERRESATLDLLDSYDRKTTLLRTLITSLRNDEKKLRKEIERTRQTIVELQEQVSFLKRHYAQYVQSAYKYGRTYDLELLLSSRSINQAFIRSQYLQRFSEQRQRDVVKIDMKREAIEQQNLLLQSQLTKQRELITEKSKEESRLQVSMKQRKQVLADIRKNKKNFQKEMERKRIAARDIEQIIEKLIEEERRRKERKEPVVEPPSAFEAMRGKLRWPVERGKLAARFGNQRHPVLKTVTENTGIDINVPAGTDVYAVAPGEVSTIWWLPSFGNLVIINHYGGYRTVYAHLSEIEVREGEKVDEGVRIGKSGESLSGPIVHFEVWKFKEKQDPELWLKSSRLP